VSELPPVASLTLTCRAYPSQWEGRLADDRPIYIRYRHDGLSVRVGPRGGDIFSAIDAPDWFEWESGDPHDGEISHDEVCRESGLKIAPGVHVGEGPPAHFSHSASP
jgi:hypothetical protein